MNTEQISDLARRAAVHAALADPARLRITDTLFAGDASPSELAAMLAMPSNLLAHHLHVLEQAGIVTRRRSQGDRRRTYLQLISGTLDPLAAPPARAARSGSCLSAPPTPPARTWPPRYGAGPAPSRRHQPAPTLLRGSSRAPSPPPGATACPCPGCGPATSARYGMTGTSWSQSATWPVKNWAARWPCTGPSPTRSRPANPRPASTRPYPSSAAGSSGSRRAWPPPPDLPDPAGACAPGHTSGLRRSMSTVSRQRPWWQPIRGYPGGQPIRAPRLASACGWTR